MSSVVTIERDIYIGYICTLRMKSVPVQEATKLTVEGVEAFFEKIVTRFGTGAKIDCPRQYLGREVFIIVRRSKKE